MWYWNISEAHRNRKPKIIPSCVAKIEIEGSLFNIYIVEFFIIFMLFWVRISHLFDFFYLFTVPSCQTASARSSRHLLFKPYT